MKKSIFILSLVFAVFFMYACNEEQAVNKKIVNVENPNNPQYSNNSTFTFDSLEIVGSLHNQCLDYLYSDLSNIKSGIDSGASNYEQYFRNEIYEFYLYAGYDIQMIADSINCFSEYFLQEWDNRGNWNISSNCLLLLNMLDDAIANYGTTINLNQFIDTCTYIENQALLLNDDIEIRLAGCGASVAKYSAVYWDLNYDKWFVLLDNSICNSGGLIKGHKKVKLLLNEKQKRILEADGKGAVVGVLYGGAADGVIGAVFGGMFGGACSSLNQTVKEATGCGIFDWLGW